MDNDSSIKIISIIDYLEHLDKSKILSYLNILGDLTTVYDNQTELDNMINNFIVKVNNMPANIKIYLLIDHEQIIGSGTLIIEQKIIHNFGKVGHIEDIVISKNHQKKGHGKRIIDFLISKGKMYKCYKINLYCSDENVKFYNKCKFIKEHNLLSLYF